MASPSFRSFPDFDKAEAGAVASMYLDTIRTIEDRWLEARPTRREARVLAVAKARLRTVLQTGLVDDAATLVGVGAA